MFLKIISEPSSTHKLFIIQMGMWHMPSSAENSNTPQYVLMPIYEFEIMKVIGYWMRNLASSCNALVGKMTTKKQLVKYARIVVHHSPLMEMESLED